MLPDSPDGSDTEPTITKKEEEPKSAAATESAVGEDVFAEVNSRLTADLVAQVGGIFQCDVRKPDGTMDYWTLDMLNGSGSVYAGKPKDGASPNTTMAMTDSTLRRWLSQETNLVAAFMAGELTVVGDRWMTTKLAVLQPVFLEASEAVKAGDAPKQAVDPPSYCTGMTVENFAEAPPGAFDGDPSVVKAKRVAVDDDDIAITESETKRARPDEATAN